MKSKKKVIGAVYKLELFIVPFLLVVIGIVAFYQLNSDNRRISSERPSYTIDSFESKLSHLSRERLVELLRKIIECEEFSNNAIANYQKAIKSFSIFLIFISLFHIFNLIMFFYRIRKVEEKKGSPSKE